MGEILTIRLNSDPQELIPWLVWSQTQQEVIASGEVEHLSQLTSYSKERDVIALADSSAITFSSTHIPVGSIRKLNKILPFLFEDELVQDVSDLHFVLLNKSKDTVDAAIIEHSQMQSWLAQLQEANITPKRLLPDVLCLPYLPQQMTAALLNDRWLLRTGFSQGFSAETAWLPTLLASLNTEQAAAISNENTQVEQADVNEEGDASALDPLESHVYKVVSYSGQPSSIKTPWGAEPPELTMMLLAKGTYACSADLLVNQYKQQKQYRKYVSMWRNTAIVAGLLVMCLLVEQVISLYQMENQANFYRAQSENRVRSALPQYQKIPTVSYMKRIVNDEIARLSGNGTQFSFLMWLSDVSAILKKTPQIKLDSIRFDADKEEFRFNASGTSFADFETLREAFSQEFKTQLGQLNRDGNTITGAFVLSKES